MLEELGRSEAFQKAKSTRWSPGLELFLLIEAEKNGHDFGVISGILNAQRGTLLTPAACLSKAKRLRIKSKEYRSAEEDDGQSYRERILEHLDVPEESRDGYLIYPGYDFPDTE